MKKTTILSMLGLTLVAAVFLTAFSVTPSPQIDPKVTFEEFLAQFPAQQLPYAITENSLRLQLDQYVEHSNNQMSTTQPKRLEWKYYRFLPNLAAASSFSRLPLLAEPIALFVTNDNYAVLYSTTRSYGYGFSTFSVAVLDKKGTQIACNEVGKVMPESLLSATISTDLKAELKTWRIDWKKDYEKNGLEGNKIKSLSHVETGSIDLMKPAPEEVERYRKPKKTAAPVKLEPSEAKSK